MHEVTYIFDDDGNVTSIKVDNTIFKDTPSGMYMTDDRHMWLVNPMNPKEIMIEGNAGVLRRSGRYPWKKVMQDSKTQEEVAKAFQLGMSFGFIDGLKANKTQESEECDEFNNKN